MESAQSAPFLCSTALQIGIFVVYLPHKNDMTMDNTTIERKRASFRLNTDLLRRLHLAAKSENRSLNTYVENILAEAIYNQPNAETKAAIEEAQAGKDLKDVDMGSLESFLNSCRE